MRSAPIEDAEVRSLAELANALQDDYSDADLEWAGSPFAWIKTRPSDRSGR